MIRKTTRTNARGSIQVFELTMDNPEDQDELNSRLRKSGEADRHTTPKAESAEADGSETQSTATRKRHRKRKS
jgi:hypothetical protein